MKTLINRVLLLGIALFFTICGFISLDKTNLIQIILCIISTIISIFLIIDIIQEIRIIKHPSTKRNKMFIRTIIAICLISISALFVIKVVDNVVFMVINNSTKATIANVKYHTEKRQYYMGDEYQRKVYKSTCTTQITYTINKKDYNTYLDTNNCLYKENDRVSIFYDNNNPQRILSINTILLNISLAILSIIAIVIYVIIIRKIRINIDE